jgi:phosphoribosyl-ATP pyrophosphohydrolase
VSKVTIEGLDVRVRRYGYALGPQSPHSAALKIEYEANELAVCARPSPDRSPEDCLEEAADVLITLLGYLYRSGVSWKKLVKAAHAKMNKNEARSWKRNEDGTYQHE